MVKKKSGYKYTIYFLFVISSILLFFIGIFVGIVSSSSLSNSDNQVNLNNRINEINSENVQLRNNINNLERRVSSKDSELRDLRASYTNKNNELMQLRLRLDEAIEPPFVSLYNRTVYLRFKAQPIDNSHLNILNDGDFTHLLPRDYEIIEWNVPFRTLESSVYNGVYKRNFGLNYLTLNNNGERYTVVDFTEFVDERPFVDVISSLHERIPNDDDLINYIWGIVEQMTVYSLDIGEEPKFPLETLLIGGGDCEDTSILMASLLKAVPRDWKIQLVYMDLDNPTDPQTVDHVIVFVDTGETSYLIETTAQGELFSFDEVIGWYFDI